MLIIKGVNFFPKQVEQALMQIPGVGANYQIIIEETDGMKAVRINVEAEAGITGRVAREGPEGGSRLQPERGRLPHRRSTPPEG